MLLCGKTYLFLKQFCTQLHMECSEEQKGAGRSKEQRRTTEKKRGAGEEQGEKRRTRGEEEDQGRSRRIARE